MKWTHVVGYLLVALVMFVSAFAFGLDAEGDMNGIGGFFVIGSIAFSVFPIWIFSNQDRWSKEKGRAKKEMQTLLLVSVVAAILFFLFVASFAV